MSFRGLPPFRNGLRLVQEYCVREVPLWRLSVRPSGDKLLQADVSIRGFLGDDEAFGAGVRAMNEMIAGHPEHPVTLEQVRALV
jgi:hypothetical protein